MPKGRERHKQVVKHQRFPERVWDQKKITKIVCSMQFCVGFGVLIWSKRCPSTLLGALPPRPPVAAVISRGKYDQLMRPGATVGMECLCTRGGENNRASLLRGVICFEALGVGVGHETVLVDA